MIVIITTLLILLLLRVPIGFCLMLSSFAYILVSGDLPWAIMTQRLEAGVESFTLLAVPFFVLAGKLMNATGVTDRIFNLARALVGHIPGGLGHANIVASIFFAGMSGAAVADAGGLGTIEIEAMRKDGYDSEFAAAVTAASSTIGPIIPPSIPIIVYAVFAETSVAALFAAGLIPGLLLGLALMIVVYYYALRRNYPRPHAGEAARVGQSHRQSHAAADDPGHPGRRDSRRCVHSDRSRSRGGVVHTDPGSVCLPHPEF